MANVRLSKGFRHRAHTTSSRSSLAGVLPYVFISDSGSMDVDGVDGCASMLYKGGASATKEKGEKKKNNEK